MRRINPIKTSFVMGSVVGLWHLVWVTLVGAGWAETVLDFVLELHFINVQYALSPFAATTAVALVLLTFTLGAFFGLVFALIWNWLTYESAPAWRQDKRRLPAE